MTYFNQDFLTIIDFPNTAKIIVLQTCPFPDYDDINNVNRKTDILFCPVIGLHLFVTWVSEPVVLWKESKRMTQICEKLTTYIETNQI